VLEGLIAGVNLERVSQESWAMGRKLEKEESAATRERAFKVAVKKEQGGKKGGLKTSVVTLRTTPH